MVTQPDQMRSCAVPTALPQPPRSARRAALALLPLVASLAGRPGLAAPPARDVPVRLLEALDSAEIHSPLTEVDAVSSFAQLQREVPRELLLEQDFEDFDFKAVGWPQRPGCRVAARPGGEGGKALRYSGGESYRYLFVLPAAPSAHYRIARSILTSDPEVDVRVFESRTALAHPQRLNHPADVARVAKGKAIKVRDVLFVHRFAWPATERWERSALRLFTSPLTRSLIILLDDAKNLVAHEETLEAFVDDLVVERLRPTPAQELALLKAQDLAEEADPERGMLKHGQLLPVGDAYQVKAPADVNFEYRYALLAPPPTRVAYDLELPARARLRFAVGLHRASRPKDAARFRVLLRADGADPVLLYDRTLRAGPDLARWRWSDVVLPLDAYAGQRVRLTLETSAVAGERGYALWGDPTVETPVGRDGPPNVILVAVDTLRADRLSCYGHRRPTSPSVDALAADGVRFARAISSSNWTSPAFATLFTGVVPLRHRVIHRARAVPRQLETMTERFRAAGYATHAVLYKPYLYNMGFEQGFSRWYNRPIIDPKADQTTDRALAWLEANADRRFFLFLHYNDPHQPFVHPEPFRRLYLDADDSERLGLSFPVLIGTDKVVKGCAGCGQAWPPGAGFQALAGGLYDSAISYTDHSFGRLLAALKARGMYDRTLVVLVSDHGEILWEHHGYFGHGGPHMHDENIHVPLIVKPPAGSGVEPGRVVEPQVRLVDVMPTVLQLAGLPLDGELHGQSLVPLMRGQEGPLPGGGFVVTTNIKHHVIAVRGGGYKYVLNHRPGRPARESLLEIARGERQSVAAAQPGRTAEMRRHALAHLVEHRSGRFLVVSGGKAGARYRVELRADRPIWAGRSILGLPLALRRDEQGRLAFEGVATGALLLFARVDAPDDAAFEIAVHEHGAQTPVAKLSAGPKRFTAFARDSFFAAIDATSPQVALYPGAQRDVPVVTKRRLNADRLEALRSLGYIQ